MSAQLEFDNKYISSTEICQQLGIHRTTVLLGIRTGKLPTPITINRPNGDPLILLWERAIAAPILADWQATRAKRVAA